MQLAQLSVKEQSKTYIPIFNQNQIAISNLKIVGNYAISISWKDGHDTGIYEFPFLKFSFFEETET